MNDKIMVLFAVLAAFLMLYLVFDIIIRKKQASGEDCGGIETAKEIALGVIAKVGLKLFTDAERLYGAKTGQLKMSSVVANLLPLLPEWVKDRVSGEWLTEQLERFLELAKEKWLANPALLGEEKE